MKNTQVNLSLLHVIPSNTLKKVILLAVLLCFSFATYSQSPNENRARTTSILLTIYYLLFDDDATSSLNGNKARVIGPLADAQITRQKIGVGNNTEVNVGNTSRVNQDINLSGNFALNPLENGFQNNDLFLVSATGGQDIDSDGNGILDQIPTVNQGTMRAIASAIELAEGKVVISPLSEIAVEYAEPYLGLVDEDIRQRLAEIAVVFFATDITGDNVIDFQDISQFDPANSEHLGALNFAYDDWLSVTASGFNLIDTLINGDELAEATVIDDLFGHALVLSTDITSLPESFQSIFVTASIFGRGTLENSDLSISLDNQTGPITDETRRSTAQISRNSFAQTTFTAQAPDGSRIVGWTGCDEFSSDLTQCSISTSASRTVTVNIVKDDVVMIDGVELIDLSNARVTATPTQLTVVTNNSLAELNQKLNSASAGDVVVSDDDKGLLRKIVSITNTQTNEYEIETSEAVLTDLIESGTGFLTKQLSNGDLVTAPTTNASSSNVTVLSKPADDKVFSMVIGEPSKAQGTTIGQSTVATSAPILSASAEGELILFDNGEASLAVRGQLDIELDFEFGVDFERRRVSQFHYITSISSTQTLTVEAQGSIELIDPDRQFHIRTLSFKPVVFVIGFVPVWLTPEVEIYVTATGEVEANITYVAQATQTAESGIEYLRTEGGGEFTPVRSFDTGASSEFSRADVSGVINPVIHAETTIELYGATGPVVDISLGASLNASLDFTQTLEQLCTPGYEVSLLATLSADFFWSLSSDSRLGSLLDFEQIEEATRFNIFNLNRDIGRWTGGSTCPPAIPYIDVIAPPLHFTGVVTEVDNTLLRPILIEYPDQQASEPVNWRIRSRTGLVRFISNLADESIELTGQINTGEQVSRVYSIANVRDLAPGVYRDTVFIENLNADGSILPLASSRAGNTEVDIRVEIMPQAIAVPVIISAVSNSPGTVDINWTLDVSNQFHSYTAYEIVRIIDGSNPATAFDDIGQVANINDINANHIRLFEEPGTTVSYAIRAYTALDVGDFSTIATVAVQGEPLPSDNQPITGRLNDTGITFGASSSSNFTVCGGPGEQVQDCANGRDATNNDDSDGHAGFSFTKLDASGNDLPANASNWSCVRDNVTQLIWEVKTNNDIPDLHDMDHTYTWYDDNPQTNGGGFGISDGGICTAGVSCDTQGFTNAVNQAGLCGANDWRMPSVIELLGIVNYNAFNPAIDRTFFPNTISDNYWSATPASVRPNAFGDGISDNSVRANSIFFINNSFNSVFRPVAGSGSSLRSDSSRVRLVRDRP